MYSINLNLDKDFVNLLEDMKRDYPEDMQRMNGIHEENLNLTSFIDKCTGSDQIADISIGSNANSTNKDVSSMDTDMFLPHKKLIGFNKLFKEMVEEFGYDRAVQWYVAEYDGTFYMHNATDISLKPYCFSGDTKIITSEGILPLIELVGKDIKVLNKNKKWENATVGCFGKQELRKLTLSRYGVTKEIEVTGNHKWFVKGYENTIETDYLEEGMTIPSVFSNNWHNIKPSPFGVAHGFYIGDGDKGSHQRANFCGDKEALLPYFTPSVIGGTEEEKVTFGIPNYFKELPSLSETKSYLYGFLSGYFSADGCVDTEGRCTISSTNKDNLEFVRNVLCILGMPVNEIRYQDRISNLTGEMGRVYSLTLSEEYLKDDFFIRPLHKERKKQFTKESRKNRGWRVVSVEKTDKVDYVYCAIAEITHSFTLDNNVLTHNCFAYDLETMVNKGLFFNDGMPSKAPKHLDTYDKHVLQFVSYASKLSTGAVGIPNYLVYSFYFWKKDVADNYLGCAEHSERMRDQSFQSFIYNMNQTLLRVNQSAFTNLTIFDRCYYTELFGHKKFPDGSYMYEYVDEFLEYQKAFMRVVDKVRGEQHFTFPVLTYSLLFQNEKFVDEDFAKWCITHNCKWSDSNIYNGSDVTVLSNCCRLLSDNSEITPFINSIGGTSLSIGSCVVNTINLRRLAILSDTKEDFLNDLDQKCKLSLDAMHCVRKIIKRNIEKGWLPNYCEGMVQLEKQFNTLGITATYEAVREFGLIQTDELGYESYTDDGLEFACKIMEVLNKNRKEYTDEYPINIESVPGERANVICCEKDVLMMGSNDYNDWIYSNQWIPLMSKCTMSEKLRLSSVLDVQCGGGAIAHINIEKPFQNPEMAWKLANEIAKKGVIYYAFNTQMSLCKEEHTFYGDRCPICDGEVTDYVSRVVGFLTPRSAYSKERKREFDKRKWFDLSE